MKTSKKNSIKPLKAAKMTVVVCGTTPLLVRNPAAMVARMMKPIVCRYRSV